jgi:Trk K+ transport system NAD-binding subunit
MGAVKAMAGILSYLTGSLRGRNLRVVAWLLVVLLVMVTVYTGIFHVLMEREDREHSWATGIYWTMTTMSTLGFGDITFTSDAGRIFSVVVLISGALFILVLLPFAFIQFVFLPWMSWRDENRAPRELPPETSGHIILTGQGAVTDAVIRRARRSGVPYVLIEADRPTALSLHDAGYRVMVGDPDSPDAYRRARVEQAALVAATLSDTTNTNIAFTVREIDESVPIVATASAPASVDILELAGSDHVLQLGQLLGQAVARRVLGRSGVSQVVGRFDDLLVAEASAVHPDLLGRTLAESQVRQRVNVNVVGIWERGTYRAAGPETLVTPGAVLILAGSAQQLAAYDETFTVPDAEESQVVIIGAGRVGRAAARDLDKAGVPFKIVDKREDRIRDPAHFVLGDAAELEVLERAGLRESSAVLITTHDDDVNVYLTIYCRRLESDIQIISRANVDRNVGTLHRAGADAVLSYASLGASAIWNALGPNDVLVLAEGLVVFRAPTPRELAGRTLAESMLRQQTGVTVVALALGEAMITTNPGHDTPLPPDADLILIADEGAEQRFLARYPTGTSTS